MRNRTTLVIAHRLVDGGEGRPHRRDGRGPHRGKRHACRAADAQRPATLRCTGCSSPRERRLRRAWAFLQRVWLSTWYGARGASFWLLPLVLAVRRARRLPARCLSRRASAARPRRAAGRRDRQRHRRRHRQDSVHDLARHAAGTPRACASASSLRGYGGNSAHWPRDVEPAIRCRGSGRRSRLLIRRAPARSSSRVRTAWRRRARAIERGRRDRSVGRRSAALSPRARREIVVIDGCAASAIGWLLPAGPLREPVSRLDEADCGVVIGRGSRAPAAPCHMTARAGRGRVARGTARAAPLSELSRAATCIAVAAIGHPRAVLRQLRAAARHRGCASPCRIMLAVHRRAGRHWPRAMPVLMTEKDAVKCGGAVCGTRPALGRGAARRMRRRCGAASIQSCGGRPGDTKDD